MPKYNDFTTWMGEWTTMALRLAEFDPKKAQDLLHTCSKEWMARALVTKIIFS